MIRFLEITERNPDRKIPPVIVRIPVDSEEEAREKLREVQSFLKKDCRTTLHNCYHDEKNPKNCGIVDIEPADDLTLEEKVERIGRDNVKGLFRAEIEAEIAFEKEKEEKETETTSDSETVELKEKDDDDISRG